MKKNAKVKPRQLAKIEWRDLLMSPGWLFCIIGFIVFFSHSSEIPHLELITLIGVLLIAVGLCSILNARLLWLQKRIEALEERRD